MAEISRGDCVVFGRFPNAPENSWEKLLTSEDRAAYIKTHRFLNRISKAAATDERDFVAVTTSGFYEGSGVRNTRPKDLWCALVNPGSETFVRMPQIYMIASARGVEIGFAAAIHRSQFSDGEVKKKLQRVIPTLFNLFPSPRDPLVQKVDQHLSAHGKWYFRTATRANPGVSDFSDLATLIADLKSKDGLGRGSGAVCRYFSPDDLDDPALSLEAEFSQAVELFRPLMLWFRDRYGIGDDALATEELARIAGLEPLRAEATAFNPSSIEDGRRRILASVTQRQGQGAFRAALLEAYRSRCAISQAGTIQVLEAAHLFPYAGPETNHVTNGILLRSDLHTLFDVGLLKISDEYKVVFSPKIIDPAYLRYSGIEISLPISRASWPSIEALRWHRAHINYPGDLQFSRWPVPPPRENEERGRFPELAIE